MTITGINGYYAPSSINTTVERIEGLFSVLHALDVVPWMHSILYYEDLVRLMDIIDVTGTWREQLIT
jgi:hypothetical protein